MAHAADARVTESAAETNQRPAEVRTRYADAMKARSSADRENRRKRRAKESTEKPATGTLSETKTRRAIYSKKKPALRLQK